MRIIYKIARTELQMLFYSPVAWFLLVVFVVQTASFFTGRYEGFVKGNELGDGHVYMTSASLFIQGLWGIMQGYLYYYIPLLTMGLVSKELSSGSIKLLYSSPVSNAQIILGKFLSMVVYAAVMAVILSVYVIYAACTVQDFELPAILVGLLGLFLLTCTYSAVGIFVSSLTSYQFVAAIGTFLVLMLLSMVGGFWQEYDVVRDITYWLSINGRASTFIVGMVCSEDLLYFILVTALFLGLTIIRLNAVRQKTKWYVTSGKNLIIIFLVCGLGYFSSRPKLMAYYDASYTKWNTLTPQSQEIVSKMDGDLSVTAYVNILAPGYGQFGYPYFIQTNREIFRQYERFKPEMKLKVIYYYDSITPQDGIEVAESFKNDTTGLWQKARKMCEMYHTDSTILKSPEEIRSMVDLTGERNMVWQIVRGNGQKAWLRTFDDPGNPFPGEAEISAAFKRMVMKLPKVGFVKGYGMRSVSDFSPRGYSVIAGQKHFRQSLLNQGFDVVDIDLAEGIPGDIDILTMADMRLPLSEEEDEALTKYVKRGGNLYILGEPRRREVMNPMLAKLFGVELTPGTLVQYRQPWLHPDALYSLVTDEARGLTFYYDLAYYVTMPTTAGVEKVADKGFTFTPLLKTDTIAAELGNERENRAYLVWNEMESLDYAEDTLRLNPNAGEVAKDYYPAMALTRRVGDKEQRIVITGDADCISNGELAQGRSRANFVMILGTFHYLSYNEMPVDVRRVPSSDTRVFIDRAGFRVMYVGFMWLLPLLFVGTGFVLWIRRKGK